MISPSPARILVIDDNRANRLLLEHRLEKEGYKVLAASGGAQALAMLEDTLKGHLGSHSIDLAVLDIMMPEIDGLQVLRHIREFRSAADLPVVMATAKGQTEDTVESLHAGANDYVVKPINFPVLLARIETQLSLKQARQALKNAQETLIHNAKTESVGLLAAGVAHEIRNPLARIHLGLHSLQRSEVIQAHERLAKSVAGIATACDKADQVVGELMKLAAESRPDIQPLDVHDAVDAALLVLREAIDSQDIQVRREVDLTLPTARYAFAELRQVLVNILTNAIQAMPTGGSLTIRTSLRPLEDLPEEAGGRSGNVLRRGDEMIAVDIEDSGPGIPPDKLLTAFDAFYTTKPTGIATGLGLTIAKKMLDLQSGLVMLNNRESGGARATILIPKAGAFQTSV